MNKTSGVTDTHWIELTAYWFMGAQEEPPDAPRFRYEDTTLQDSLDQHRPYEFETVRKVSLACLEAISYIVERLPDNLVYRAICPKYLIVDLTHYRCDVQGFIRRGWDEAKEGGAIDMTEVFQSHICFYDCEEKGTANKEQSLVWSVGVIMYQMITGRRPSIETVTNSPGLTHKKVCLDPLKGTGWESVLEVFTHRNSSKRPSLKEAIVMLEKLQDSPESSPQQFPSKMARTGSPSERVVPVN